MSILPVCRCHAHSTHSENARSPIMSILPVCHLGRSDDCYEPEMVTAMSGQSSEIRSNVRGYEMGHWRFIAQI